MSNSGEDSLLSRLRNNNSQVGGAGAFLQNSSLLRSFMDDSKTIDQLIINVIKLYQKNICLECYDSGPNDSGAGDNNLSQISYIDLYNKMKAGKEQLVDMGLVGGKNIVMLASTHPDAVVAYLTFLFARNTVSILDHKLDNASILNITQTVDASCVFVLKSTYRELNKINFESCGLVKIDENNPRFSNTECFKNFVIFIRPDLSLEFSCQDFPTQDLTSASGFREDLSEGAAVEPIAVGRQNNTAVNNLLVGRNLTMGDGHDVATILFSSGTTGKYKGVMLTHENIIAALQNCLDIAGTSTIDRVVSFLPLFHVYPLINGILLGLVTGVKNTLIPSVDGKILLKTIKKARPTIMLVVPRVLDLILKNIESSINAKGLYHHSENWVVNLKRCVFAKIRVFLVRMLIGFIRWAVFIAKKLGMQTLAFVLSQPIQKEFGGSFKKIICGGASLDKTVHAKLESCGFNIYQGYGLTETSGGIVFPSERLDRIGVVGFPVEGVNLKLDCDDGSNVGEILVKGPQVMLGYFKDMEETRKAFDENGWLKTGDLGQFEKNGSLKIVGRIKEVMVLENGEKAIPGDIEAFYKNIPEVKEIAVFGVPNKTNNDDVYMAVVIEEQKTAAPDLVEHQIRREIAARMKKIPLHRRVKKIVFVESLPKTTLQKVKRAELRKLISETQ